MGLVFVAMNVHQNAKFVLVIADYPEKLGDIASSKWEIFLTTANKNKSTDVETRKILKNVWQIDLKTEMNVLIYVMNLAKMNSIPLRILFLDDAPDWIHYSEPLPGKTNIASH